MEFRGAIVLWGRKDNGYEFCPVSKPYSDVCRRFSLYLQEVLLCHDKSHRVANQIQHIQSMKQGHCVEGWDSVAREEQDRTLLLYSERMTERLYVKVLY